MVTALFVSVFGIVVGLLGLREGAMILCNVSSYLQIDMA